MYQAVIFDWDGTLADTRRVIVLSFQKTLSEAKLNVNDEYIERRIGIGAAETFREILRAAKRQVDESLIECLVERKSHLEIELTYQVKLFPGARELLKALLGKSHVGLASMNNYSVIEHMLEAKNIKKYFETILTAESISLSKPNPEIFLKTAEKLKTNPARCVVLEDSIFGVEAAKSGGMGCIGVTTGVYSREELEMEGADLVVDSLADERVLCFIQGSGCSLL
jgi:HAD superfamily hydrolase (TIGR01509 family)